MTSRHRNVALIVAILMLRAVPLQSQQPEAPLYTLAFRNGATIQFGHSKDSVRVLVRSPGAGSAGLRCERPPSMVTRQWADSTMVLAVTEITAFRAEALKRLDRPAVTSAGNQSLTERPCGVALHQTYLDLQVDFMHTIVPLDPIEYSVLRRLLRDVVNAP